MMFNNLIDSDYIKSKLQSNCHRVLRGELFEHCDTQSPNTGWS